jgi:hypothetical protein
MEKSTRFSRGVPETGVGACRPSWAGQSRVVERSVIDAGAAWALVVRDADLHGAHVIQPSANSSAPTGGPPGRHQGVRAYFTGLRRWVTASLPILRPCVIPSSTALRK